MRRGRRRGGAGPDGEPGGAVPVEVRVTGLAHGPHGVARGSDRRVVFVRGVVPGETAVVRLREEHGTYAFADLLAVRTPAPARRVPPCPHLPRCGGCPWQHVAYEEQLAAKTQTVREALVRIGRWADPPVRPIRPSPSEFGYRGRLTLRVAGGRIGFYAAASHDLVPVEACLLASAPVGRAMAAAADLVRRLGETARRVEIVSGEGAGRAVLVAELEGPDRGVEREWIGAWLAATPDVAGVVLRGRGWRREHGETVVEVRPEPDVVLRAPAGAFTQVNPGGNRLLVGTVLELGGFTAGDAVLDLYAGVGNLGLPVARRVGRVVLVERDPLAAAAARANAAALGLAGCTVRAEPAERAVAAACAAGERFDVVVLDPPRGGAPGVVDHLLALAPPRIVYVSCDPAALARDLGRLRPRYALEAVQPVDLFPQTYHVETVARAVLTC